MRLLWYYTLPMSTNTCSNNVDWPSVYAARRDRLRAMLPLHGLDALLVSHAANRFYLSGFELHDGQPGENSGMIFITANGEDWLATDSRYRQAAEALWPQGKVLIYGGEMAKDIAALGRRLGSVIGFESKMASVDFLAALKKFDGNAPVFIPADGLVENLRIIKDPCEIAALKDSFALNHAMLAWLKEDLQGLIGKTERDLAWLIEKYFRENGAQGLAFSTIVASGANAARPHAIPGDVPILAESSLLIDAGCRKNNYCSDQTRSWWIGRNPAPQFAKALGLAQEAQKAAMNMMLPGVACRDVYFAARKVFEKAGVAEAFTHGLGHGVGLETHERPSLSPRSDEILRKGMVVTVEPGLYYPEWGGVRWEHTVLVEDNGISVF